MRCLSCNCVLSDREAVRKSITTGDYLDLCNKCFESIKDEVILKEPDDYEEIDIDGTDSDNSF